MAKKNTDDELERTINWLKTEQHCLEETETALRHLEEIEEYGHYTLDVTIGGSTTSQYGNGYQESKVVLDWLDANDRDRKLKSLQAPLFDCMKTYLSRQIAHYETTIAKYRKQIKALA